jgi:hypothetical protein
MVEFSHHGGFEVHVSGNILCATLSGSWNVQTAEAFATRFMAEAQPLLGNDWGHLVVLEDWDLGVPEIIPIIERLVGWCIDNGLTRAAQVYSPSMIKQYQLNEMVVEEFGPFLRHSFSDQQQAETWLGEFGFKRDSKSA